MSEEQRALLIAMMFGLVGDYIETMKFVVNKNLITQRRPQAWMVDNAYSSLFQNAPQYAAMATSPTPVQGQGPDIGALMTALLQGNASAPNVTTADSVVIGGVTYQKV
jgi:Na+/H+ antiporter NhaD/arsenite permease-like protein